MPLHPTPAAEVHIDAELVRALIEEQHPDLATLPLISAGAGWDNALFRIGDELVARLPRRSLAVPLVSNEHRWLPEIATRVPIAIPAPIRTGVPGCGYPWPWSIAPWFHGETAMRATVVDQPAIARELAGFLIALHAEAPADAPYNEFRSVPLAERSSRLRERVTELGDLVDGPRILDCWDRVVQVAPWSRAPLWIHGDLHPGNVLIRDGRISAVIDFGDLCAGDPATDLASAWMLFAPPARRTFRESMAAASYTVDEALWTRARGWALALNVAWLAQSADDEDVECETRFAIEQVLADS